MDNFDNFVTLFFVTVAIVLGFVGGCTANKSIQSWDIVKLDGRTGKVT